MTGFATASVAGYENYATHGESNDKHKNIPSTIKIAQNRILIMGKEEEARSEVRVGGTDKKISAIIATSLETGQKTAGRGQLVKKEDGSITHPPATIQEHSRHY